MIKKHSLRTAMLTLLVAMFASQPVYALGTYAKGRAFIVVTKLESKGVFFTSYEGVFEVASYDKSEKCDEDNEQCYTPTKQSVKFSISDDNKDVANFVLQNIGRLMIIDYKIHRITPIALSTDFEVVGAAAPLVQPKADFQRSIRVVQTGKSKNFTFYGKILRMEYRGTANKSWECLVYNREKDKVLPISITDEEMAKYVQSAMATAKEYYIGVSRAIFNTGALRDSNYDIYAINYDQAPGLISE
ncbi:MAG: hypothetical protein KDK37_01175 [Leptospiraceae bacterium]|nr:hypothetical protein [Leptospiraceae bacterium]MCB1302854.1 hypothetical protein [Leptospiraceae bacterium]